MKRTPARGPLLPARTAPAARFGLRWFALCLCLSLTALAGAQSLPLDAEPPPDPTPGEVEVIPAADGDVPDDEAIAGRIRSIFDQIDALSTVQVTVRDGIVTLSGTVENQAASAQALRLAQRVQGTVLVLNNLGSDLSVETRFGAAWTRVEAGARSLVSMAPLLLVALVIVGLALVAARLIGRIDRLYRSVSQNVFVQDLLRHVVKITILLLGVILALMVLDATALIGSVAGALGILGLAIGFATRDTVENYIASILLSLRQPFRNEDFVRIEDMEGMVLRLTARATVLMSLEGNHIRIPNARVFKATIVNYTRNPLRRFEFRVGVDTGLDLGEPRRIALDTLASLPAVLGDPGPACLVEELGDSSVILVMRGWVDQRKDDLQKTRSEAQRRVKEAFDDAGIAMPEPIYNVNLRREQDPESVARPGVTDPDFPRETGAPGTTDPAVETGRDSTVEKQLRADRTGGDKQDLLDPGAPIE